MLYTLLTAIPEHLAQRLDLLLYGAVICLGAGLLLLLIAVILLRRRSRRLHRSGSVDYAS